MSPSSRARRPSSARRRRLGSRPARLAAALASIALLGALPAAAQASWAEGPQFAVTPGSLSGSFSAAPDGSSTAAWFTGRWANPDADPPVTAIPPVLRVQHARPDGTVAAPITLGAGSLPVVATSANNLTAVAWIEGDLSAGARTVRVTMLGADGAILHNRAVETLTAGEAGDYTAVRVAVDAAGNATVVWTRVEPGGNREVRAARVGANGSVSTPVTLGVSAEATGALDGPSVTSGPTGTAWVGWIDYSARVKVARLNASGGIDRAAAVVSEAGDSAKAFSLSASSAGAAVAWLVLDPDDDIANDTITGARLPASGSLVGPVPFSVSDTRIAAFPALGLGDPLGLAIGPDGAITLGWSAGGFASGSAMVGRFAPGQATAVVTRLGAAPASFSPTFGAAPDGSLLAGWVEFNGSTLPIDVARVAPDGSFGPTSTVTSLPFNMAAMRVPLLVPQAFGNGGASIGVATYPMLESGDWGIKAYRFDETGPTVTVDVPASAVVLTPARFTGTVADPANAPLTWDFGDGTTATGLGVTHVYAAPGTYTVSARATDSVANETVVTRTITITPAPAPAPVPGPGPGTTPTTPGVAAALKIAQATRKNPHVTVTGTISKLAKGKVNVAYAQKVGRKTIRVQKTATLSKGRWKATLTLPRSLRSGKAAKGKGAVTVTFAGTAAVESATAKRTVSIAKAKKRAKR